jgi:hypothetical protein
MTVVESKLLGDSLPSFGSQCLINAASSDGRCIYYQGADGLGIGRQERHNT